MIVKVEIRGDVARITSSPNDPKRLDMTFPASRVRKRFAESDGVAEERLEGWFAASEAIALNPETKQEYPLDVLEIGERLDQPKEAW